jgi:hypothetical protein
MIRRAMKRMDASKDYFQAIDGTEYNLGLKTGSQVCPPWGVSKKRAETLVTRFRQYTDEIEAISIVYSCPYAAGLWYCHAV